MLSTRFKEIYAFSIIRFSCYFSLFRIISIAERIALKIKCAMRSLDHMFRMVIFRLCILYVTFLIKCVIVIKIVKSVELINFPFSISPYIVGLLQLFTLFLSRIRILLVRFKTSVTNYFVYH